MLPLLGSPLYLIGRISKGAKFPGSLVIALQNVRKLGAVLFLYAVKLGYPVGKISEALCVNIHIVTLGRYLGDNVVQLHPYIFKAVVKLFNRLHGICNGGKVIAGIGYKLQRSGNVAVLHACKVFMGLAKTVANILAPACYLVLGFKLLVLALFDIKGAYLLHLYFK